MKATPEQQQVIDRILLSKDKVLSLGGLAGSGKSWCIAEVAKQIPVQIITPTWKAALVLHKRGFPSATTIHDFFLKPLKDMNGNLYFEEDEKKVLEGVMSDGLLIVDEASMVDRFLYDTIVNNWGGRIVFVGDHGQLPPVNGDFSVMSDPDMRLEEVHRQAKGNPIIELATKVRLGEEITEMRKGDIEAGYIIGRKAFEWASINNDWQCIVRTNASRHLINVRNVHGNRLPVKGSRLIILDNQPRQRAYNGMIVTHTGDSVQDGLKQSIPINDGEKVRWLNINTQNLLRTRHIRPDEIAKQNMVEKNQVGVSVDYAYAITCHKAQGSSFPLVAIENSGWTDKRWLYTAITRAENCVILDGVK